MEGLLAESKGNTTPLKILVVDDNELIASILQALLEDEGYQVRMARGAEEGYSAYLQFRPDVVVTDIQMPGEGGLELVKRIRLHDPNIRTIYMSGDISLCRILLEEETKRSDVRLLRKPFSKAELVWLLSEHFQEAQAGKDKSIWAACIVRFGERAEQRLLREGVKMDKGELVKRLSSLMVALVMPAVSFLGCAGGPLTTREKAAAVGTLGGAAAGGIIGSAVGRPAAGALIGGGLGLGAGALVGDQLQGQETQNQQQDQQIRRNQAELDRQRQEMERLRRQQAEY